MRVSLQVIHVWALFCYCGPRIGINVLHLVMAVILPFLVANRPQVFPPVEIQCIMRGFFTAFKYRHDILTVNYPVRGQINSCQRKNCTEQVKVHTHHIRLSTRGDNTGPAGYHGNPETALEYEPLSPPGIPRTTLPPGSVIAGKYHKCIAINSKFLQCIKNLPCTPVKFLYGIPVQTAVRFSPEFF